MQAAGDAVTGHEQDALNQLKGAGKSVVDTANNAVNYAADSAAASARTAGDMADAAGMHSLGKFAGGLANGTETIIHSGTGALSDVVQGKFDAAGNEIVSAGKALGKDAIVLSKNALGAFKEAGKMGFDEVKGMATGIAHTVFDCFLPNKGPNGIHVQGGGGTNGVLSRAGSCITDAALIAAAVATDGASLGIDMAAEAAAEESAGALAGEGIETAEGVTGATSDTAAEAAADAGEEGGASKAGGEGVAGATSDTAAEAAADAGEEGGASEAGGEGDASEAGGEGDASDEAAKGTEEAEEAEEAKEVEEAAENTCSMAKKYNPTTLAKMYVESQWMMPMSCAPQNVTMWLDMGKMFAEMIVGMPKSAPPPAPPGMTPPKCGVPGSKAEQLCKPFYVGNAWECLANETDSKGNLVMSKTTGKQMMLLCDQEGPITSIPTPPADIDPSCKMVNGGAKYGMVWVLPQKVNGKYQVCQKRKIDPKTGKYVKAAPTTCDPSKPWKPVFSAKYSRNFYHNCATNASQWTAPPGFSVANSGASVTNTTTSDAASGKTNTNEDRSTCDPSKPWKAIFSAKYSRNFYHNCATNVSQWTAPPGFSVANSGASVTNTSDAASGNTNTNKDSSSNGNHNSNGQMADEVREMMRMRMRIRQQQQQQMQQQQQRQAYPSQQQRQVYPSQEQQQQKQKQYRYVGQQKQQQQQMQQVQQRQAYPSQQQRQAYPSQQQSQNRYIGQQQQQQQYQQQQYQRQQYQQQQYQQQKYQQQKYQQQQYQQQQYQQRQQI